MKHRNDLVRIGLIFLSLISPASLASEQGIAVSGLKGHDLLRLCTSHAGSNELNFCFGYVEGIRDGLVWLAAAEKSKPSVTISGKVTEEQLTGVVVKYLKEHPERRERAAGILVLVALKQAFPPNAKQSQFN
jgi:Ssp1 endopeptidase immunity protein Rap1a